MHECGAAIIIFTADEEFKDLNGQTIFGRAKTQFLSWERPARYTVRGSSSLRRLASHFPRISVTFYIEFDKDRLDAKVGELFRELIAFKLIMLSVAQ